MIKVVNQNLIPQSPSFGKYNLKVNSITYMEKLDSSFPKVNYNLGIIQAKIETEGGEVFIPKEEVFKLRSLYRCIIDTGVIINEIFDNFTYNVNSIPKLITQQGLMVLCTVKIKEGDITKLGVSVINLGSKDINITKYMEFAVLTLMENRLLSMPFSYE